jgi:hypothetical protein
LSTWMSRGFSSAEAALKSSANAETIEVRRMLCGMCCVVEMSSRVQWIVFTVKRPEFRDEHKVETAGYLQAAVDP